MSNFKFGPDLQGNSPAVIIPVKKFFQKETFNFYWPSTKAFKPVLSKFSLPTEEDTMDIE